MSYRQLQGRLQNYQQAIPEYLQSFFQEYSSDPYQGAVLDELARRNQETFGQNLGQMASYFGGAGRMGGGMMGRSLADATAENQERLSGQTAGLLSQDYQGHLGRMMEAAGIMGNLQGVGMQGTAQGYGDDQRLRGVRYTADQNRIASMYNTDAYRDIGMGNLGMNRDFGTWDRQYRSDMMPYEQLNMIGSGVGSLMAPYGSNQTSGYRQSSPGGGKGGNMAQGAFGGGMMGYGMGSGGGRSPSSANVWGTNTGFAMPGMRWR